MRSTRSTRKKSNQDRQTLISRRRQHILRATVHALEQRWMLAASWTGLSASGSAPSNGGGAMNLLPTGNILIQNGTNPGGSPSYFTLSPQNNTGSYINGSWNSTGSLHESRLFYSTAVLPDGRVFAIGGEFPKFSNTVEIYNPATGIWTNQDPIPTTPTNVDLTGPITGASNASPIVISTPSTAQLQNGMQVTISGVLGNTAANGTFTVSGVTSGSFKLNGSTGNGSYTSGGGWSAFVSQYGDDPLEVLPPDASHPDGRVLAGYFNDTTTYLFDPNAAPGSQWTTTGAKLHNDRSDEESWVKLKDGSILSYDVFSSQSGTFQAQRYVPSTGLWVDASTLDGSNPPSRLSDPTTPDGSGNFNGQGSEMGPSFLMPDGRVVVFGANGNTAIYNPTTDKWSAGPAEPVSGGKTMVATDDPGAVLPNGDILISLSPLGNIPADSMGNPTGYSFPGGTNIYEFNTTSGFTDVSPGGSIGGSSIGSNAFAVNMVVLPTGQVLESEEGHSFQIFTEDPATGPQNAWRPTITQYVENSDLTSFTLTGTQLTGIDEGANYGDDNGLASNYPVIQFKDSGGNIFYGTTSNWSTTNVLTGSTPETVRFTLPPGKNLSDFAGGSLAVIVNGIASASVPVAVTPSVTGPGNQSAVEGASKSFSLGSFIDPDGSPWNVNVHWGDGRPDTTFSVGSSGTIPATNHTYPEEGTFTATVTVTDSTNLSDSANFQVTVSDPAVIASPVTLTPVEGQNTGAVTVATFTDPGGPEVVGDYAASIDWGDGATTTGTISLSSGTFSVTGNHTYAEESAPDHPGSNPYAVTVTIQHESAPTATANSTAVVSDPAVAPTGGFLVTAVEGSDSGTQPVATFTDPGGPESLTDYSAQVNWGDGTPVSAGTITLSGGTYTIQSNHVYDEEGTYLISISITHENAPLAFTSSTAVVSDPAVIATGTSLKAIACLPLIGVPVATFTDPGGAEPNLSDFTGTINNHYQVVSINWGDGTPLDTSTGVLSFGGSPGSKTDSFTVSGSHTYASEGSYTITVVLAHELAPTTTVNSTVVVRDNIGLLTLDPSGSGALTVSGNGGVVVNNCGAVVVDSNSPSAAIISGNGAVSAMDIDVTGGTVVNGNGAFVGPLQHEPPMADIVGLPLPAAPATTFSAVNYTSSTPLTLSPGTYVGGISLSGQASVTLLPGVYYLQGGGLKVSGQASLAGAGVFIINAPNTVNDGVSFTGQGNIVLTAPLPSTLPAAYSAYAGITFFQTPTSTAPFVISGNGGLTMDGILYAPHAPLFMTGNGGLTDSTDHVAPVAAVIVYDAILSGNGVLTINADALASNQSITPLPGAAGAIFTSFTSSVNPAVPGQPLTFTATMSAIPGTASPPAGVVDFFDETTHLDLGFVTLAGGVASVTGSLKSLGGHVITANYFASSPNYAAPAPDPLSQQIQSEAIESGSLFIGGISGDVQVQLNNGNVVVDTHDGSAKFTTPLAGLAGLVVYAQGSAQIQVDSGITLPAFLFAGDGNGVRIQAGGGPTVEVGGAGTGDVLTGGSGRTILIGGAGASRLQAGTGGTILIGGTTDFDKNLAVLQTALTTWSSAATYAARLVALGGTFNAGTVHNNALVDQLRGGGGSVALDWFFGSALDQITRSNASDVIVPIV